jgi:hypothetical protein
MCFLTILNERKNKTTINQIMKKRGPNPNKTNQIIAKGALAIKNKCQNLFKIIKNIIPQRG